MSILITGGAGHIGSNLIRSLNKKEKIICLDSLYSGKIENLPKQKNLIFKKHDVRKKIDIKEEINEIWHLACPASPPFYMKKPIYTLETSVFGTKNMLELARKKDAKILFTSTSEVYGDPLIHPQKETYYGNVNTLGPRSCYDEGKRVAETFCYEYFHNYGLNIKIARLFNTYGPYMRADDGRVVSSFIANALKNKPLQIFGDGKQTRSFTFVQDTIRGLKKYMALKKRYLGPINIGSIEEHSVSYLAEEIIKLTKSKSKIEYKGLPKDDPKKRKPDISRAKKILKWSPKVKLKEGLKKTINFFKKDFK